MKPNWENFLQLMDDMLCVVRGNGEIVEVNHRFADALGMEAGHLVGRSALDFIHPDDVPSTVELLITLQSTPRISQFNNRYRTRDGSYMTLSWNAVVMPENADRLIYAIARDVSNEAALANALKLKTLFLEQTSRVGKIGGWEVDLIGKTGKFTAETHRIYGTDPISYRPNIEKGIDVYIPEHRAVIRDAFEKLVNEGESYELELQIVNTIGLNLWVRTIGEAQFENGRIVRVFGTLQDISQEKALETSRQELEREVSEQRDFLSKLMDLAPVGICRTDPQGHCTFVNKALCLLTSYSPEETFGMNWVGSIHPEDRARVTEQWQEFVAERRSFVQDLRFIRKDGSSVWARAEALPIRNAAGEVAEYLACLVDVTEQRRVQNELEKASTAKSMFLANVSHEIRTPLNAIIGFSQILAESPSLQNSDHREDVSSIKRSGELLLSIINDVLDISKIEAGNLQIEKRPFRIHDAVHLVVDMMRPGAERKGLELRLEKDPTLPLIMIGDELRLKQILINLISNAVKFTEHGRIEVGIHLEKSSGLEQHVVMRVRDTGIGIPPLQVLHIFLPFSQADSSTTRRFGGTGLGLAISKRLCELMQGEIKVESEERKGSQFTARLVLHTGITGQDEKPSKADLMPPENFGFLRTLIVEDDPLNRKVALAALKKYGIRADTCNNGLEAWQVCQQENYDLILMDVQMPIMGGHEATSKIRLEGLCQKSWILAMTANAFDEDRRLCLESGMNDFMAKPIDFKSLQQNLARAAVFIKARNGRAA